MASINSDTVEGEQGQSSFVENNTGVPHSRELGDCGDGLINGWKEDCDLEAVQDRDCKKYGGTSGNVTCQNDCLYDISNCLTPAVDRLIGGRRETCNCNCKQTRCTGGCGPIGDGIESRCNFTCDSSCDCDCGDMLKARVERCEFRCNCRLTALTIPAPDCRCFIEDCNVVAGTNENLTGYVQR